MELLSSRLPSFAIKTSYTMQDFSDVQYYHYIDYHNIIVNIMIICAILRYIDYHNIIVNIVIMI